MAPAIPTPDASSQSPVPHAPAGSSSETVCAAMDAEIPMPHAASRLLAPHAPARSSAKPRFASAKNEQRRLASGGKGRKHPRCHVRSDCGWHEDMLNLRESCVECAVNDGLEYDSTHQRIRQRRSSTADDALRKTREARWDKKCVLEGNIIVDISKLSSFLANKTACCSCATRASVQLAFDFVAMLDAEAGMRTRNRSGPSYSDRLKQYVRQLGGHAKAVNIPSFAPVGEANQGFASTIHLQCSGAAHSCDLDGNAEITIAADGVARSRSRFASHRTFLSTSPATSLLSQSRWPSHPQSADNVDHEATGQARHQINVRIVAILLHFGKGGKDAVKLATLLGIPLSPDWGINTFPSIARHYGKNVETLALHACDLNLANEIKLALAAGTKPEPVGGEGAASKDQRTEFRDAFFSLRTPSASPFDLGPTVANAAKQVGQVNGTFGYCVRVPVCIDMGWSKRSSGRRYDSNAGLESAIGGRSKRLLDYIVMQKDCHACRAVRRKGQVPTASMKARHDCRENHHGRSSKSMEARAAVMLQYRLNQRFVTMCDRTGRPLSAVMDPVVSDDDAAARAQLRPVDPSGNDTVARGPTWIGTIQECCDPNHRLKVLTKPLYAVGTNAKIIAYVKKALGYALKQGAKDDLPTMKRRIACAKNHMCGNHSECNLFFPGNCHALH